MGRARETGVETSCVLPFDWKSMSVRRPADQRKGKTKGPSTPVSRARPPRQPQHRRLLGTPVRKRAGTLLPLRTLISGMEHTNSGTALVASYCWLLTADWLAPGAGLVLVRAFLS